MSKLFVECVILKYESRLSSVEYVVQLIKSFNSKGFSFQR